MIIQRDSSPERISGQDRLQVEAHRSDVGTDVHFALSVIYGEWSHTWSSDGQNDTALRATSAGNVINHTFHTAEVDSQVSELAADRAVEEARLRVKEVHDYELPA